MTKTFQDLIQEVHEKGICQECGGCVSFCSSAEYGVIGFTTPNAPPNYLNKEKCLECGICYCICPQTRILDDGLNQTYKFTDFTQQPMGPFVEVLSCQATDEEFLRYGTDGGVVNSIINYLFEKKAIDGAVVAKTDAPFAREAMVAKNREDLIAASGVKLGYSQQLEKMDSSEDRAEFNTYTIAIPKLNRYKFKKFAVVGTPCQIYTLRCMQQLGVTPSENLEVCLGLFCFENFKFDQDARHSMEEDFNIKFDDIEKINIKEDLIFTVKTSENSSETLQVPFDQLTNYMRPACRACYDFLNIYADISFGGLGSPDKYTTVITRTDKGKKIIADALNAGIIKKLEMDEDAKNDMINLITRFSSAKIERRDTFMSELQ